MTEREIVPPQPEPERPLSPPPATTTQRSLLLIIAAVVIIVDHVTKLLIENWLPLNHTWAPIPELAPYFRLTHVSNTGAAFGLFPSGSLIFTLIAVLVAAIIIAYNYWLPGNHKLLRVALAFQLGGALGNFIDRLRLGHVTDFLDFGPWPVFNLADTAIVTGVIILGYLMLAEQKEEARQRQLPMEEEATDGQQPPLTGLQSQRHNEQTT